MPATGTGARGWQEAAPRRAGVCHRCIWGLLCLAAALLVLSAPIRSGATPALSTLVLTDVGISAYGAGSPGTAPITLAPGGQFTGWYTFNNEGTPLEVISANLNLTVVNPSGQELSDASAQVGQSCQVPSGASGYRCSRGFTLRSDAMAGTYTVRFSTAPTVPGHSFSYTFEKAGWLVVQGGAAPTATPGSTTLTVSPTSLDLGSTANTASFSVSSSIAGTTWTVSSNQSWLTVSPTSGTGNGTVNVTANRTGLSPGNYNAVVTINSSAGTQTVSVSMAVSGGAPAPASVLGAQVMGLRISPGNIGPGGVAQITAAVTNTGNTAGSFRLSTNPNSVCGPVEWAATLTPGQSALATIPCNIRTTATAGNQGVEIGIDMSVPGQPSGGRRVIGVLTLTVGSLPPTPGGPGQYFAPTGFWVRNEVPCPGNPSVVADFLSEFNRLGSLVILGYPASRPYWKDGFCYQAFQRGIVQWRPDYDPPQGVLANTMDWLYEAGKDDFVYAKEVARHFTGDDGANGDFNRAKEIRFAWMTDEPIRDAYFSNPNPEQIPEEAWDPALFYGLPTSRPERRGPFIVQRFQRYVLQKWIESISGMPSPGTVVGVLAGDLAKEAGLVPSAAAVQESQ